MNTDRYRDILLDEREPRLGLDPAPARRQCRLDRGRDRGGDLRQPPRRLGDRDPEPRDRLHARGELRARPRRPSTRRWSGSRAEPSGHAGAAANRSPRNGSRRSRTRIGASTASGSKRGVSRTRTAADRRSRRIGHGRARSDLHGRALAVGWAVPLARPRRGRARRACRRPADEADRRHAARAGRVGPRRRAVLRSATSTTRASPSASSRAGHPPSRSSPQAPSSGCSSTSPSRARGTRSCRSRSGS